MLQLVVAIKSNKISDLHTAVNFIQAVCNNPKIKIKILFFYQHAVNCLINNENNKLIELINKYHLTTKTCNSACKKRGLKINQPFLPGTIIEFLDHCNNADRIIQF